MELDARLTSGEVISSLHALSPGLADKTIGIIGMGNTARHFALMLRPFNCKLLIYSPSSPAERWSGQEMQGRRGIEHTRTDLDTLLRSSDVLSLHCPYSTATRGLIGKEELGKMKSTAVLINTARGGIVDERALEAAFLEGRLGGAGIDCWEIEPANAIYLGKLGKMPNVICLPHV
jgi:D-3-phosphoglycerate dehydrogenase